MKTKMILGISIALVGVAFFAYKLLKSPINTNIEANLANSFSKKGMVWVDGGKFTMGCLDDQGRADEYPPHVVRLKGFWIDETEVTNAQFRDFVEATGYVTTAEKVVNWDDIKMQAPHAEKPHDSLLQPSSLVFIAQDKSTSDWSSWWQWKRGANWRHPQGFGSTIEGKDDYPVVQVSWDDAIAYAHWAGKRLPTEAEWEYAARGGLKEMPYSWGKEPIEEGSPKGNTWQGNFPNSNTAWDGYKRLAPVKSYPKNGYGLYDLAGNVWEWCADLYNANYYKTLASKVSDNPISAVSYDPDEPTIPKRTLRGGSFLCHSSVCSGYRVSARMKSSQDTGLENTGFRCVSDP